MTLSEHDGTEIVSVSLTDWEARCIIEAIQASFIDAPRDEHRELTLKSIQLALENQVTRWERIGEAY